MMDNVTAIVLLSNFRLDRAEDEKALEAFRTNPPAFLLVSAKRKTSSK